MQTTLPLGVFRISAWKNQLLVFRSLSSRSKLMLLLLAGVSLSMLAAGIVLRQRRRRYRAKALSHGSVGGAPSRQNTFGGRSSSSSIRGSIASSHRRADSFPSVYIIDEDDSEEMLDSSTTSGRRLTGRSSVDMLLMQQQEEYDLLRVEGGGEEFLSLSQNNSTAILSDEYFDVPPEMDSLITSYPSMNSSNSSGVVPQNGYLSDSDDSFESASETLNYTSERHRLYISALVLADNGNIKCRILRTKLLGCSGDQDFLAKVHCIRQAFDHLLLSEEHRAYAIDAGKDLILSLMKVSNTDPQSFLTRYNEILQFVQDPNNLAIAEEELEQRGVACLNIYDIALDFMLMDAFDDLSSPPSTLLSVIQNGWISNGIKQSMLNTAVWSILKAKKSVLKNKNGFMAKFYLLSETMSPVFAWGFLGTDTELKERCLRFKERMMILIRSMFSLEDVRYSSVQLLGDDIMRLTRQTVNSLSDV